jgi:hypothetical protein
MGIYCDSQADPGFRQEKAYIGKVPVEVEVTIADTWAEK